MRSYVQPTIADLERFAAKFVIEDSGCWRWISSLSAKGYGEFWLKGGSRAAHRVAYWAVKGKPPDNTVLDHEVCDNPSCVNPNHLVAKSDWDNRRRSKWYGDEQCCKRKHPKTVVNTYQRKNGKRECRKCRQLEMQRYYTKQNLTKATLYSPFPSL